MDRVTDACIDSFELKVTILILQYIFIGNSFLSTHIGLSRLQFFFGVMFYTE